MSGSRGSLIRLADVRPGQRVRLVKINGRRDRRRRGEGCSDARRHHGRFGLSRHCGHGRDVHGSLCRRLAELGLTPGVEFEVLQRGNGPIILAIRNSRLALGRGTAEQILVEIAGPTADG